MVPFAGIVATGGKFVKKGVHAASGLGKNVDNVVGGFAKKFDELVETCTNGCFTAGTQIVVGMGLAEDGTILYDTKNIEDIQVGDLVYST